jgi:putative DNA methylase
MTNADPRVIEDYLPIQAISKEASREKSVRKGHISTLHLWWARRPLVACRAAVYGALVPADRWVKDVDLKNPPADAAKAEAMKNGAKKGLNRRAAGEFVTALCKYPGDPRVIEKAQGHILDAHADRLTAELAEGRKTGKMPAWVEEFKWPACAEASAGRPAAKHEVTRADIEAGRAPRPRVLDMFAGGGAIPLEALRLGCEAYALDLNPVAHIIELCTLVYPQKYGRPDPTARGMTGPKNAKGETTWGGLAEEVRYWGNWVLREVRKEIGDLYPPIPDPKAGKVRRTLKEPQMKLGGDGFARPGQQELHIDTPIGYLTPVAYLYTRTVRCKNPSCGAIVPLVKQTWLCKKEKTRSGPGRYAALKMVAPKGAKQVRFEVVEEATESELGFDPADFSEGGNATCPFCNTVADGDYVKAQGMSGRMGQQFMAAAATRAGEDGKVYLAESELPAGFVADDAEVAKRLAEFLKKSGIPPVTEAIEINPRSMDIDRAGFTTWAQIFTPRQQMALSALCAAVREAEAEQKKGGYSKQHSMATTTLLGCGVSKFADFCSTLCTFNYTGGRGVIHSFPQQSLPMVWDFAETNPFNPAGASWIAVIEDNPAVIEMLRDIAQVADVRRGSALAVPLGDGSLDAVITDPPYYDNVSYSNLSDFFHIWLRRAVGHLYPEHFAMTATPKKAEVIAAAYRHGGVRNKAKEFYEKMMGCAFAEAHRTLKPGGQMTVVYAHKTTLGWSTLVDAMKQAGFTVTEAWPLDTERKGRVIAMDTAALASSIFLVARKREAEAGVGSYETDVRPDLEQIVRERVKTLWEMDISGADLVIACVGAGLRAFTRYARVEFANGEEVPAERFLMEVETAVLETILARLSKEVSDSAKATSDKGQTKGNGQATSLQGVDPATRFYVLWRYTYRVSELDAGEAIIFANGTHVELDGPHGLSSGSRPLVEKKKSKYRLRDYSERGQDERLGMPAENGQAAPLVDVLHRVLWLMESRPGQLVEFFRDARPNLEQIRLVAQALAGPALKGGELGEVSPSKELAALKILTSNWRSIAEAAGPLFGQKGNGK